LREEDARSESLWEFLVPQKYGSIAKAGITVAMPTMEDEEDLKSPSNRTLVISTIHACETHQTWNKVLDVSFRQYMPAKPIKRGIKCWMCHFDNTCLRNPSNVE